MTPTLDLAWALDPCALFRAAVGAAPDKWQASVLRSQAPRVLLNCCRQSGKSTTVAVLALWTALFKPGTLILILSPSQRQSSEMFRKVQAAYLAVGQPVPATTTSATTLELVNRSRVVSLPGEESTIRGFSGVGLLLVDEASRVDDALMFATRPMLSVSRGRLLALSTPFGRRGWWFQAWEGAEAWQRVRVTWRDVPRFDEAFIEEERRSMPAMFFASEYESEFVDAVDQMFGSAYIDEAISADIKPLFEV